jgi:GTPase Era involved in 16S rRNA processing
MLLGTGGRIMKEIRERAAQILIEKIQRPVSLTCTVTQRKHTIGSQNRLDNKGSHFAEE